MEGNGEDPLPRRGTRPCILVRVGVLLAFGVRASLLRCVKKQLVTVRADHRDQAEVIRELEVASGETELQRAVGQRPDIDLDGSGHAPVERLHRSHTILVPWCLGINVGPVHGD
jgi:hypothetical protein